MGIKKHIIRILTFILILGTLTSCVGRETKEDSRPPLAKGQTEENIEKEVNTNEPIELTLWSFYEGGWDHAISEFRKLYPNIKINVKAFSYGEYEEVYLNALVTGNVPDIMSFDSNQFRNFKDINGLQDLTQVPFNANEYQKQFPEALWQTGTAVNNKKLIGIPFSTSPLVTYYRKDIMEKYGFPSEPEELATFMENPSNWLKIGETLNKDGTSIMQWPNEIMNIYKSASSFYDNEYNFQLNTELINEAIVLSQKAYQSELFRKYDLYTPEGQAALRENKLAMTYLGTYGAQQLSELAPEQAGKWRVTRLPFNVFGWTNSSILSIPAAGVQKEAAWKFIEFYSFELIKHGFSGSVPGILPARTIQMNGNQESTFLGGQQIQKTFIEIMSQTNERFITPLDEQSEQIWQQHIDSGIEWNVEPSQILEKITQDLNQNLGQEQKILRENIEK